MYHYNYVADVDYFLVPRDPLAQIHPVPTEEDNTAGNTKG